uniref:Endonuclease/exonuclease/phosphatase domain-containing protein n=1 Tax=Kalanchoe fedtschenkoi TaxID=63787 RepID=A0A7N0VJI1_KALFE
MRLSPSSSSVRFLAAASSDSTNFMASRPPYRGGRHHNGRGRGYCDRSTFGDGESGAGNSHHGGGGGSNSGFRQVDGGGHVDGRSFNNVSWRGQLNPRPQVQQNRPPYYHQNQGFNGRPGFCYNVPMNAPPGVVSGGSYGGYRQPVYGVFSYNAPRNTSPRSLSGSSYGGHRQPVNVNQQPGQPNPYRPRSKPLDFREWEYAKPEPPPHWDINVSTERFSILSYNILADYLANDHWRKLYFHIPRHMLSWEWRKNNLFRELSLWSPDVMCFQEVDRFEDLLMEFKRQGYDGIYKMRTGNPMDGCSIFWRTSKFKLLHEEIIEFNQLDLRDNVAQICVLESVQPSQMKHPSASDSSSAGSNRVVVCNIHVLYNPKRGDIKLGQVRLLFEKAYAVSNTWNNAPVVVCGDFNCTPKSPLYNYITEQKLDLSDLARDKVSGQASAEIRAPIFYNPNPGVQFPTNAEPLTSNVRLNSEVEKSNSHLDSQKQVIPSGTSDKPQCQPDYVQADEPNGTGTEKGDIISIDVEDVNALKNTPPLSTSPNIGSLKAKKVEKEKAMDNSVLYGVSSNVVLPLEPSADGTIISGNNETLSAEKAGHATEASTHTANSLISDDSSNIETIFEEPAKILRENGAIGEDDGTFLSELTGESLDSDYNEFGATDAVEIDDLSPEIEPFSPERNAYDPSLWTPAEIETATGDANCMYLEHPLKLTSTYTETEDLLGTRDASGEPLITSYHRRFCGTVDYIWRSQGLQTVRVLSPIRKQAMQWTAGFPTKKWGSDHIALVAQLAFVEGAPEHVKGDQ